MAKLMDAIKSGWNKLTGKTSKNKKGQEKKKEQPAAKKQTAEKPSTSKPAAKKQTTEKPSPGKPLASKAQSPMLANASKPIQTGPQRVRLKVPDKKPLPKTITVKAKQPDKETKQKVAAAQIKSKGISLLDKAPKIEYKNPSQSKPAPMFSKPDKEARIASLNQIAKKADKAAAGPKPKLSDFTTDEERLTGVKPTPYGAEKVKANPSRLFREDGINILPDLTTDNIAARIQRGEQVTKSEWERLINSRGYNKETDTYTPSTTPRPYTDEAEKWITKGIERRAENIGVQSIERSSMRVADTMADSVIITDRSGNKTEVLRGSAPYKRALVNVMDDKEYAAYHYILGRYGDDEADKYIDEKYKELDTRMQNGEIQGHVAEFTSNHPYVANTVVLPIVGLKKAIEGIWLTGKAMAGQEVNPEDYSGTLIANAIESQSEAMIKDRFGKVGGTVGGFLYQTYAMFAENAAAIPANIATGGSMTPLMFAGGGAANAYLKQIENGTFGRKGAVVSAVVAGGVQGLAFKGISKAAGGAVGKLIPGKTALRQFVQIEATKTLAGAGINSAQVAIGEITDLTLNGEYSNYQMAYARNRYNGMNKEEARKAAARAELIDPVISSAVMGGIMGAVMGVPDSVNQSYGMFGGLGKSARAEKGAENVIMEGLTYGKDTTAYKYAEGLFKQFNNGKDIKNHKLGTQVVLNGIEAYNRQMYASNMQQITGLNMYETAAVPENANGAYDYEGNIFVSPYRDTPLHKTIQHEVSHGIGTESYRNAVKSGEGFEAAVQKAIGEYAAIGRKISRAVAEDEVAAQVAEYFTKNTEANLPRLLKESESSLAMGAHIRNKLRDLRARMKAKKSDSYTDPKTGITFTYEQLYKMEREWEKALVTAKERGYNKGDGQVSYSIDAEFRTNYDKWVKNGRVAGKTLTVGKTSEPLKSIGVKDQDITWDTGKIIQSLNKHKYLTDDLMKQIPEILENPIIVMESKSHGSRITMFGEVYDADGLPIMAVLELLPTNRARTVVLDEIKIASTHSRKHKNPDKASDMTQTQNLINNSKICYIDPNKNRTDNWLTLHGLQLPAGINQYGSIHMITYPAPEVNPFSKNIFSLKSTETRAAQNAADRREYGIGVNSLVKNLMDEIGVSKNRRNEVEETAVRSALKTLKNGDEKAARAELTTTFADLYKEAKAPLTGREVEILSAIRHSEPDLRGYKNNGELTPEDFKRFRSITHGTSEKASWRQAPDQRVAEWAETYPEYFRTDEGTRQDPAKQILDVYDRLMAKSRRGKYNPAEVRGMAQDMADRVIDMYNRRLPAQAETPRQRRESDIARYGQDIEAPYRGMKGIRERDVERIGEVVRRGLDEGRKAAEEYIRGEAMDGAADKAVESYDTNYIKSVNDFIAEAERDGSYSGSELDLMSEQMFISFADSMDTMLKEQTEAVRSALAQAVQKPKAGSDRNPFIKRESLNDIKAREERVNRMTAAVGKSKISQTFTNSMHKANANSADFIDTADTMAARFSYVGLNNVDDFNAAIDYVDTKGAQTVHAELAAKAAAGQQWTAMDTMRTIAVKSYYERMAAQAKTAAQRDAYIDLAVDVYETASIPLRESAQAIQALAILNSLTPEGRFRKVERDIAADRRREIAGRSNGERVKREVKAAEAKVRKARREAMSGDEAAQSDTAWGEVRRNREQVQEAENQIKSLERQLDEGYRKTVREIKNASNRIKSLEEQIERAKAKMPGLEEDLRAAREMEALSKTERDKIKAELSRLRKEKRNTRDRYERSIKSALELRDKVNDMEKNKEVYAAEQALENIYKKYDLPYVPEQTRQLARGILHDVELFGDDPGMMIKIILENSKARKTGAGFTVEKGLEWLGKVEGVQILKDVAIQQAFGMITDTKHTPIGAKVGTVMRAAMLSAFNTAARNIKTNFITNQLDKVTTDLLPHFLDWAIFSRIAGAEGRQVIGHEKVVRNTFKNSKAGYDRFMRSYLETALAVDNIVNRGGEAGNTYGAPHERTLKSKWGGAVERYIKHMMVDPDEFQKGVISSSVGDSLLKLTSDTDAAKKEKIYAEQLNKLLKSDKSLTREEAELKAVERVEELLNREHKGKRRRLTAEEAQELTEYVSLYRTFQSEMTASKIAESAAEMLNKANIAGFGLGDLVMPFVKVPANVFQTGLEFSPLGYIKAMYMIGKVEHGYHKKGETMSAVTQRQISEAFGRATAGTIGIAATFMAFGAGILLFTDDDDSKTQKHNKSKGISGLSFNLSAAERFFKGEGGSVLQDGDSIWNIANDQPLTMPAIIGGKLWQLTGRPGMFPEGGDDKDAYLSSLYLLGNTIKGDFEGSISAAIDASLDAAKDVVGFTSLNNIANNWKNADGSITKFAAMQGAEWAVGFIPNILTKQTNALNEGYSDTYHTDDIGELVKFKFYSKLPFLYKEVPKSIDIYGSERSSTLGGFWADWVNENFNPNKQTRATISALQGELDRLLPDFGSDILPSSPKTEYKGIKLDDDETLYSFKLSSKEYEEYSRQLGSKTANLMGRFMMNSDYKYLADWQRAEMYKDIIDKAGGMLQKEWVMRRLGKSKEEIADMYKEYINEVDSYATNLIVEQNAKDYLSEGAAVEEVMNVSYKRNYTDEEKAEKIKGYQKKINECKNGEAYKYKPGANGKKERVYSSQWTAEEKEEYIKSKEKLIAHLESDVTQKEEQITGAYTDLPDEHKKLVLRYLKNNVADSEKIILPDEIRDKRPDLSKAAKEEAPTKDVTETKPKTEAYKIESPPNAKRSDTAASYDATNSFKDGTPSGDEGTAPSSEAKAAASPTYRSSSNPFKSSSSGRKSSGGGSSTGSASNPFRIAVTGTAGTTVPPSEPLSPLSNPFRAAHRRGLSNPFKAAYANPFKSGLSNPFKTREKEEYANVFNRSNKAGAGGISV